MPLGYEPVARIIPETSRIAKIFPKNKLNTKMIN